MPTWLAGVLAAAAVTHAGGTIKTVYDCRQEIASLTERIIGMTETQRVGLDATNRRVDNLDGRVTRLEDRAFAGPPVTQANQQVVQVGDTRLEALREKEWLTTSEVAEVESVNEDTVRRRIHAGRYEARRLDNGSYLVRNPVHESCTEHAGAGS